MSFDAALTPERLAGFAYKPAEGRAALVGRIVKSVDTDKLTVQAVLTFPVHDLAGDYVRPDGLDFASFKADPRIDIEHSGVTVAWCRKSLAKPGAPLAVAWHDLDVDGDGTRHRLPVGTSYFDPSCRKSMQVFRLVAEDKLPGVSLEFRPIQGRRLGKSTLEPRDAFEFTRCDVLRYTHCAQPVNPGALTVTKAVDALLPVIQTGKFGSEALDPQLLGVLKKSLATYTPKRVTVRVEKAMDEMNDDAPDTVYDDAPADESMGDEGTPTVQACYDCAQMLLDVVAHVRELLTKSEHVKGRDKLGKIADKGEALAEDAKALGDQIDGELNGGAEPSDEEPVGEEVEKDEAGVMKARSKECPTGIRAVYLKAIKRFSLADLSPQKPSDPPLSPEQFRELKGLIKSLVRNLKFLQPAG